MVPANVGMVLVGVGVELDGIEVFVLQFQFVDGIAVEECQLDGAANSTSCAFHMPFTFPPKTNTRSPLARVLVCEFQLLLA